MDTMPTRHPNGTFGIGNRAWQRRKTSGAKRRFVDANALSKAAVDYFNWVEVTPLFHAVHKNDGDMAFAKNAKSPRPMTKSGLCAHVGISTRQWSAWKNKNSPYFRPDLLPIMQCIEQVIWVQKFEGAAAGLFNAKIISRELWAGSR
jgi:hypothetical protein